MDKVYNYTGLFLFHGIHMISWCCRSVGSGRKSDSRRSTENCDLTDLPQRPALLHIPDDQPDTWWLPGEVTLGVAMGQTTASNRKSRGTQIIHRFPLIIHRFP